MTRRPVYFIQGKSLHAYCKDNFGSIVLPDNYEACIYSIKNTTNGKLYVGHTCHKPYVRWYFHFQYLILNRHHSKHLQGSWNKHGFESFEFSIIEFCSVELAVTREQFWMDLLCPVYNTVPSAQSTLGYKHTPETRKLLSEQAKKRNSAQHLNSEPAQKRLREVQASEEFSKTRSRVLKGHKKKEGSSENYKAAWVKRKAAGYKLVHSLESRAKMSASHKARKKTPEHLAAMREGRRRAAIRRAKLRARPFRKPRGIKVEPKPMKRL